MEKLKKPKPKEVITYSGFVMHNGRFIGFKEKEFTVVKPGHDMVSKNTIYVGWFDNDDYWEGWIPTGAYKNQIPPRKEGYLENEEEAFDNVEWGKVLSESQSRSLTYDF